jgi:glycerol-3-phosphate dehydrogenase
MGPPGFPPRKTRLGALAGPTFDLVIVGGGITGAAVARDAAARGLTVALLEKNDWAAGTSSRSTKLVHGGLRYLEQGELGMVFESLSERALLQRLAPHLVRPLDFLFPAYRGRGYPSWKVRAGLTAYDLLALGRAGRHRALSRAAIVAKERLLDAPELSGGALAMDCRTDDARLTLENVLDAVALGAVAVSRMEVIGFSRDPSGRVSGVRAADREGGRQVTVSGRVVVSAVGPWTDGLAALATKDSGSTLALSRGSHLVIPASRLPLRTAVAFPTPDGRLVFAVPWASVTLVGTTEKNHRGSPDEVYATAEEIRYLLAALAGTFPSARVTSADVLTTYAGVRPLVQQPGRSLHQTSREEHVEMSRNGLLTVAGGKLTTHRRMAARVVDAARARLAEEGRDAGQSATGSRLFPGTPVQGLREYSVPFERACGELGIDPDSARHLAARYGARATAVAELVREQRTLRERLVPGVPDIAAEIVFAARHEDARSVSDALIRRTHLFWNAPRQGTEALPRVAASLSRELGWSREQEIASSEEYQREIERSREPVRATIA